VAGEPVEASVSPVIRTSMTDCNYLATAIYFEARLNRRTIVKEAKMRAPNWLRRLFGGGDSLDDVDDAPPPQEYSENKKEKTAMKAIKDSLKVVSPKVSVQVHGRKSRSAAKPQPGSQPVEKSQPVKAADSGPGKVKGVTFPDGKGGWRLIWVRKDGTTSESYAPRRPADFQFANNERSARLAVAHLTGVPADDPATLAVKAAQQKAEEAAAEKGGYKKDDKITKSDEPNWNPRISRSERVKISAGNFAPITPRRPRLT